MTAHIEPMRVAKTGPIVRMAVGTPRTRGRLVNDGSLLPADAAAPLIVARLA